jgi:hypothetical protein
VGLAIVGAALVAGAGCGSTGPTSATGPGATDAAPPPPAPVTTAGAPGTAACTTTPAPGGWSAVFGERRTREAADGLRDRAESLGFKGLSIDQQGCSRFVVVLHGLSSREQATEFGREARTAGLRVRVGCSSAVKNNGEWNAVFGYRKTEAAARRLETRVSGPGAGFQFVEVDEDACGRGWRVYVGGLTTPAVRKEFRREAKSVGFEVTFVPS